jgi:hypothetical protein
VVVRVEEVDVKMYVGSGMCGCGMCGCRMVDDGQWNSGIVDVENGYGMGGGRVVLVWCSVVV